MLSITIQGFDFVLGMVVLVVFIGGVGLFVYFSQRKLRAAVELQLAQCQHDLMEERRKSHGLLERTMSYEAAARTQKHGKASSQKYKMVTVLFADIQGFSKITDEINAEELIDQLDKFFYQFDAVVKKYAIEKIKTIGDAYMCAGGIPIKNQTNPIEVVLAALEMMKAMKVLNALHRKREDVWELRMGIDTGPIIAGVVGQTKLAYDIWGSTVNVASRMQSAGEPGRINITENTYLLVNNFFTCEYRGKIPIKNKGDVKMYFVNGILPNFSVDGAGIIPNDDFFVELQLVRLADLEEVILPKLERELPPNLYYHNIKHTIDVYTQVELIGRKENIEPADMLILRTAALLHDLGFTKGYQNHEEMGAEMAREILPAFRYSHAQVERVVTLILATKLPQKPRNILEQIICDADLDYLGRTDFIPVSNMLFKELHERGMVGSILEWNKMQVAFIEKHHYFTKTATNQRDVNKAKQLENIKNWMREPKG